MTQVAPDRPRILVVAGPNGAGKTTLTEAGLAHEWFAGCEYVNPDVIAQQELGDWNNPESVLKAAKLATERREACLLKRRSLAFETVFSSPDKVDFVRRAIAAGFFVRLFFVGTDSPDINAARVARRMLQGGHEVPIEDSRSLVALDRKLRDRGRAGGSALSLRQLRGRPCGAASTSRGHWDSDPPIRASTGVDGADRCGAVVPNFLG